MKFKILILKTIFLSKIFANEFSLCSQNIPSGSICLTDAFDDLSRPPKPWPCTVQPSVYLIEIAKVSDLLESVNQLARVDLWRLKTLFSVRKYLPTYLLWYFRVL